MTDLNPTNDPTWIPIQFDPRQQRMIGTAVHGNAYFDVPYISQITDDLYVGGCTNGLILPKNIEHVLSLYPWESYNVRHEPKTYLEVRMYDSEKQAFDQVDELAQWVNNRRKEGPTLVHCQAGLNRSNLIAGRALILSGMLAEEAIGLLRGKRSPAVLCNKSFENWLLKTTGD